MTDTDDELTVDQAADLMGLSVPSMYRLRYEGRGPLSTKIGGRLRYRRSDIEFHQTRVRELNTRGGAL